MPSFSDDVRRELERRRNPAAVPTAPPPPRIGDFSSEPAPAQPGGPPAPPAQPVVNHIRIGTLNARPGRGWIRRGGRPGFGTNSFNIADGGSA